LDSIGVVFCGGEGTRFRPLTYYIQKVMIPVGPNEKPILEYIVRNMCRNDIKNIVFMVGYRGSQIRNYFDDGRRFGVSISYRRDVEGFRGIGTQLLLAFKDGVFDRYNNILIHYGDILTAISLRKMYEKHRSWKADVTLALSARYPLPIGVAELDRNNILRGFAEKPELGKPVSIGILWFSTDALGRVYQEYFRDGLDLMGNIIPWMIKKDMKVYGYVTEEFWYDVGSIDKYEKLNNEIFEREFGWIS